MADHREFEISRSAIPGVTLVSAHTARSFARHTHDEFGIGVIDHGAQSSSSGRGPVTAESGDLITVNPNEIHDGTPLRGKARAWRMLYLAPALIAEAARPDGSISEGMPELAFPMLRRRAAAEAFGALHHVAASGLAAAEAHWEERLAALLAMLLDVAPAPTPTSGAIERLRARIDAEPADDARLSTLAHEAGLSPFALVRAFVRHTGLPPHAYRVQKRIQLARRLVMAGTPLSEAAQASGFADQSHMTRAFARAYGLTPGAIARA